MFNRILAALVAAPMFLAACEDVPNELDPDCTVDCEVDTGEDTDPEEAVTVPFAARTTISGSEEPCMVRYESRGDSGHSVTKPSGETVQLNAGEIYDLFVGTPDGLHTRSDGVRFTSRPTEAKPVNSASAAPQTENIELDPYFSGSTVRCEITHNPSGSFDSWATSNGGNGIETTWMEWSYPGENDWDPAIEVAANCLDFGNHGVHCFNGKDSVTRYTHSGNYTDESKSNSVVLTPNSFSFTTSDDWYDISCEAH